MGCCGRANNTGCRDASFSPSGQGYSCFPTATPAQRPHFSKYGNFFSVEGVGFEAIGIDALGIIRQLSWDSFVSSTSSSFRRTRSHIMDLEMSYDDSFPE